MKIYHLLAFLYESCRLLYFYIISLYGLKRSSFSAPAVFAIQGTNRWHVVEKLLETEWLSL